jgi:hypothetical protein
VTTSRICLTLVLEGFLVSASRTLRAASQSKGECSDLALKGDLAVLALSGEQTLDRAGEGGILRLGNEVAPVGGADMGGNWVNGLGGISGAVAAIGILCLCSCSQWHEQSVCSLLAVDGADSGVVSPDSDGFSGAGELRDMAALRKSV